MDPEHAPLTYPVVIWLQLAQLVAASGDRALAATIHRRVDCRRLTEQVAITLSAHDRAWLRSLAEHRHDDAS